MLRFKLPIKIMICGAITQRGDMFLCRAYVKEDKASLDARFSSGNNSMTDNFTRSQFQRKHLGIKKDLIETTSTT